MEVKGKPIPQTIFCFWIPPSKGVPCGGKGETDSPNNTLVLVSSKGVPSGGTGEVESLLPKNSGEPGVSALAKGLQSPQAGLSNEESSVKTFSGIPVYQGAKSPDTTGLPYNPVRGSKEESGFRTSSGVSGVVEESGFRTSSGVLESSEEPGVRTSSRVTLDPSVLCKEEKEDATEQWHVSPVEPVDKESSVRTLQKDIQGPVSGTCFWVQTPQTQALGPVYSVGLLPWRFGLGHPQDILQPAVCQWRELSRVRAFSQALRDLDGQGITANLAQPAAAATGEVFNPPPGMTPSQRLATGVDVEVWLLPWSTGDTASAADTQARCKMVRLPLGCRDPSL